jgi:thiamine-monophosphate kinase
MKLRQLGEDRLIERLRRGLRSDERVLAGPGDDCAVVAGPENDDLLLLKTDCIVQGVHFSKKDDAAAVGWKAMMRPLSDFAAMAGVPRYALITFIAPPGTGMKWAAQLYGGLEKAARLFDVRIVGGETSRTDGPVAISVSVTGVVEKGRWTSRRGGRAGDLLFVTGRLGGSGRGKHLKFRPRIAEARWLTEHFQIHAMMDLSDGLGADLPRLAKASGLAFQIDQAALPRNRGCSIGQAISDGEDFELLFALAPEASASLQKKWRRRFPRLLLTHIGRLKRISKVSNQTLPGGYVHFQ